MQQKMLCKTIKVAARDSKLSQIQVEEVINELLLKEPTLLFEKIFVQTKGDLDKKQSLKTMEKTDFFTDEIDKLLLKKKADLAIHSRKDLPEPLTKGLYVAKVTKGIDPRDCLVCRDGVDFFSLPSGSKVATSSFRREKNVLMLRPDFNFVDVRGSIDERLAQLDQGLFDAIVIAEAALIRLKYTHLKRIYLPGETTLGQGELALVIAEDNFELKDFLKR